MIVLRGDTLAGRAVQGRRRQRSRLRAKGWPSLIELCVPRSGPAGACAGVDAHDEGKHGGRRHGWKVHQNIECITSSTAQA